MFRYRVEDKDGKVLAIKNKMYEAQTLYRKHYKEGAKIVVLESGPEANVDEDFNSLTNVDEF